jgi:hypothetical protein
LSLSLPINMFATNPPTAYFSGYPQSQAPTTSGMNASQSQTPDHSQLGMPSAPSAMVNGFPQEYGIAKTKRKQVRNACSKYYLHTHTQTT